MSWKYNKKGESRSQIAKKYGFGKWMEGRVLPKQIRLKMSTTAKKHGFGLWMNGKKHSEDTKIKMSEHNNRYWQGKHFSEEHKNKLNLIKKGQHISPSTEFKKGMQVRLGSHMPEESKRKIIETKRQRDLIYSGERHPMWKGGISKEPYSFGFDKKLKEQIKKRDKYRCQQCFRHQDELFTKKGKKVSLKIHHIDFNKKNTDPMNLISLCSSCHSQTNYNRDDWTNYFQDRIKMEVFNNEFKI